MGKRLIPQRRGRGTPRYRTPSHRFKGDMKYPSIKECGEKTSGQVIELINDPGRSAPVAKVLLESFKEIMVIAPEGIKVGDWIGAGEKAKPGKGNILPLGKIQEGTQVYNLEMRPGDGGKLVRASGTSAYVVSHERGSNMTYVQMPSKKTIALNSNARATIGKVAGGGRTEKPFVHAGQAFYKHKAKNKLYPRTSGNAMNAVDHPHGGGRNPHSRPSVTHDTPPGAKVGHISPKRTGRRKR